jgi:hypothetical protein
MDKNYLRRLAVRGGNRKSEDERLRARIRASKRFQELPAMQQEDMEESIELLRLHREGKLDANTVTFSYNTDSLGRLTWNVTKALALVQEHGSPLVEVPREVMEQVRDHYRYREEPDWRAVVDAADPTVPGVGAGFWHPDFKEWYTVLIDGTHRCVRAVELHLPFHAYLLSPQDSYACLLFAPPKALDLSGVTPPPGYERRPD